MTEGKERRDCSRSREDEELVLFERPKTSSLMVSSPQA